MIDGHTLFYDGLGGTRLRWLIPNKNKMPNGYQVCQVWYLGKGRYTAGPLPRMLEPVNEEEDTEDISGE